jgi:DNA-binding XRE family transcriptional regulator
MTVPINILAVRTALGIAQPDLGALLGVHGVTIHRWEKDLQRPSAWHHALLAEFAKAARKKKDVGPEAVGLLAQSGVAAALLHLLNAAR